MARLLEREPAVVPMPGNAGEVVRLERVTYWYPETPEPALRDLDLGVGPGLTVVAGPSGGGKSTFLRLLDGLVPQFHGGRIAGRATVAGLDPFRTPIREMASRVGLVFQDPETQSVYGTVEREVAFGLENAGLPRPAMRDRVDEALRLLAIEQLRDRRLATLSGGERQRVQLAAALALRPAVLALDEPTSQLDPEGAAAVVEACLGLAAEGQTVIVAEHRLERLLPAADRLLVVDAGAAIGPAPVRDLAERLASPPPVVELAVALGWEPVPLTPEEARDYVPLVPLGLSADRPAGDATWTLRGVTAGFGGTRHGAQAILSGVDLAGAAGEVVVLAGSNGSGKTTLLRTLAGLLPPLAGEVTRRGPRTAYLPQHPAALLHLPTVRAEVELTIHRAGSTERPESTLAEFGLLDQADRYPRDLSAGQRQRAALAAILAGTPDLVLLDEPTRGMDLAARRALGGAIGRLRDRGSAVVVATHDTELAAEVGDRIVELRDGSAVELGPPEAAFAAGSPRATDVAQLLPGGPVSVGAALRLLRPR